MANSVNIPFGTFQQNNSRSVSESFNFILPDTFDPFTDIRGKTNSTNIAAGVGNAVTLAFNDEIGAGQIQAPAGKKLLVVILVRGSTGSMYDIRASDTANTEDGALLFSNFDTLSASESQYPPRILIIPSNKFLTFVNQVPGDAWNVDSIVIYELDN